MSNSYQESLENARGKRQFLALGANAFIERGVRDIGLLNRIKWESLVGLPGWCLLTGESLKTIQNAAGAIYLLPAVQASVDGRVLIEFRDTIGALMFQNLSLYSTELPGTYIFDPNKSIRDQIQAAGSSVLLGTITDTALLKIYFGLMDPPSVVIGKEAAERIYHQACDLVKRTNTSDGETIMEPASIAF